jgi:hypothetical protein
MPYAQSYVLMQYVQSNVAGFYISTNNKLACHSRCSNYKKGCSSTIKYRKYSLTIITQFIVTIHTLLSTNYTSHLSLHYLKGLSLHGKK